MSTSNISIDQALVRGITDNVFPTASLLVSRQGKILYRKNVGCADDAIFDIASLTKPFSTASLFLKLLAAGKLRLEQSVSDVLKSFDTDEKRTITWKHLLDHTSGLPAWKPYYEALTQEQPSLLNHWDSRLWYEDKIAHEPLEQPIGSKRVYSDLGFIILGIAIENIFGEKLETLFRNHIAQPLRLDHTFFQRVGEDAHHALTRFMPTEDCTWRKKIIQAEVHDGNAYALGGVAGHAGLFSTVDDIDLFLQDVRRQKENPNIKLGWDTPSPQGSQAGKHFSSNSIGHLGYSGCSMWIDFEQDFHIVLLTNRVHPTVQNDKIKAFRPLIHNLAYQELIRLS